MAAIWAIIQFGPIFGYDDAGGAKYWGVRDTQTVAAPQRIAAGAAAAAAGAHNSWLAAIWRQLERWSHLRHLASAQICAISMLAAGPRDSCLETITNHRAKVANADYRLAGLQTSPFSACGPQKRPAARFLQQSCRVRGPKRAAGRRVEASNQSIVVHSSGLAEASLGLARPIDARRAWPTSKS